ncbi:MAG: UPF0179 family protein [Candidatus Bathyarchaeia archaeon]
MDTPSQRKVTITLVGLNQAKEGFTFIHRGPTPKCGGCEYLHVCVRNLESGRIYKVVGLRDKTLYCPLSEEDMRVVEVVESEIEGAIPSKQAMEGAMILFQPEECDVEDCKNFEFCFPKGLLNGDRCEIVGVTGSLQCPRGLPLVRVLLRRVPVS